MNTSLISIIIPTGYSVDSILSIIGRIMAQTYSFYEIIIMCNHGETAYDLEATLNCSDPRVKIFRSVNNNTSLIFQAFDRSLGEFILILDNHDWFKHDKFYNHVDLFNKNPPIEGILSASIYANMDESSNSINLTGPILDKNEELHGAFFSFSDGIFCRKLLSQFFQDPHLRKVESLPFLALSFHAFITTCRYQVIEENTAANIRLPANKYFAEQTMSYIETTFHNPDCILFTGKLNTELIALVYLKLSIIAFEQHEVDIGQKLFRNSIRLDRSILDFGARAYFMHLLKYAIQERLEINTFIRSNIVQLPPEFAWITEYVNEAIGCGYFYQAVYYLIFNQSNDFNQTINLAKKYGFRFRDPHLAEVLKILEKYEVVFSSNASRFIEKQLIPLRQIIGLNGYRWLKGRWQIKRAWTHYVAKEYTPVPQLVTGAVFSDPAYLLDRGILSIFIKSMYKRIHRIS